MAIVLCMHCTFVNLRFCKRQSIEDRERACIRTKLAHEPYMYGHQPEAPESVLQLSRHGGCSSQHPGRPHHQEFPPQKRREEDFKGPGVNTHIHIYAMHMTCTLQVYMRVASSNFRALSRISPTASHCSASRE